MSLAQVPPSSETSLSATRQPIRSRLIVAATIGNALEFYDFLIYAFFATWIAAAFFPGRDPTSRLLLTFGTFGVSFLARPVGAVVLGHYADRRGRVASMTLSIGLMSLGAVMIALMPDYDRIGLAAPLGVLLARLIQGFSLGGEFGSSTAFLIEHSPRREAWAASWQSTSQYISSAVAVGVAWLLASMLPPALFHSYGFRIGLGLGALLGPTALWLRRGLPEPASFSQAPPEQAEEGAAMHILAGAVIAACVVSVGTAVTYLDVYLPTYAVQQLHLTAGKALGTIFLSYVLLLALTPLRLFFANRFDDTALARNRIGPMVISCVLVLLAAFPSFLVLDEFPSGLTLLLLPVGLNILLVLYLAPLPAFMGSVFTVRHRGIGLSLGYASGVALFGGFAPFINVWLISATGNPKSPAFYLIAVSVLTIVALFSASRRLRHMV